MAQWISQRAFESLPDEEVNLSMLQHLTQFCLPNKMISIYNTRLQDNFK